MEIFLIFGQIFIALIALSGLPLLRLVWRRRIYSAILLFTASQIWMWELVLYRFYPAAYLNYHQHGNLHIGPVTLRPPLKPDVDWGIALLVLISFLVFHIEEVHKKKRRERLQTGGKFV